MSQNTISPILRTAISNGINMPDKAPAPKIEQAQKEIANTNDTNKKAPSDKVKKARMITFAASMAAMALAAGITIHYVNSKKIKFIDMEDPIEPILSDTGVIPEKYKDKVDGWLLTIKEKLTSFEENMLKRFEAAKARAAEAEILSKTPCAQVEQIQQSAKKEFNSPNIKESYDHIMELIEQGRQNNWKNVPNIEFETRPTQEGQVIFYSLREFQNDKLIREASILTEDMEPGSLSISEYLDTLTKKIKFNPQGECTQIALSKSQNPEFEDEVYRFSKGKLTQYIKNALRISEDETQYDERWSFYDTGKLKSYHKDILDDWGTDMRFKEGFEYDENTKPIRIMLDYNRNPGKASEYFEFENGKIKDYWQDFKTPEEFTIPKEFDSDRMHNYSVSERFVFENNEPKIYQSNYKLENGTLFYDANIGQIQNGRILYGDLLETRGTVDEISKYNADVIYRPEDNLIHISDGSAISDKIPAKSVWEYTLDDSREPFISFANCSIYND